MTTQPQPTAKPAKPRLLQDGRDMFWSLVPLVAACIVLAGLVGMCTFAPGASNRGQVPSYDAAAALRADAQTLGFPVRLPRLPQGWQPNSGSRGDIEDGRIDPSTGQKMRAVTSTVGYISPTGMYLSLTQSNADEDKLVGSIHVAIASAAEPGAAGRHDVHPSMYPTGTVDVDGTGWIVYQGDGKTEGVWTTRLDSSAGPAQIAITGAGNDDEFRTLAAATQAQPPLPR
ncbi:hypothetical protein A5707_19090 [Mycobacterium kyorinense]|uniref:DUF4245 domain-containing protein n=1 Tax=Mycobacterium kyorinense TaxID=487514 RepID=A0A1A2ZD30_9MYCO|nr:DUF4245 domain-containing protein [Mycobacterium kyorinense]OBI47578.1 hypothetical protein A5707_19090 [Mycobacterium kyorinense]